MFWEKLRSSSSVIKVLDSDTRLPILGYVNVSNVKPPKVLGSDTRLPILGCVNVWNVQPPRRRATIGYWMKLEAGNREYILVSHSISAKVIRSNHGKDILESTKQYDAAYYIVEKIHYKAYRNGIIDLEFGNNSICQKIFCRKKRNIKFLCRNIYLVYHYIVSLS